MGEWDKGRRGEEGRWVSSVVADVLRPVSRHGQLSPRERGTGGGGGGGGGGEQTDGQKQNNKERQRQHR